MSFIVAGAAIVFALGSVHLLYTFRGPKLLPRDPSARAQMEGSALVITRETTVWKAWIGFNASHSMGAILFGLVYGFLANANPVFTVGGIMSFVVGFAMLGGLAVLAKVYWFRIPFTGVMLSLICYVLSIVAWRLGWA